MEGRLSDTHGKRIQNPWGCGVLLPAPGRPGSWEESQRVTARPRAGAAQTLGCRQPCSGSETPEQAQPPHLEQERREQPVTRVPCRLGLTNVLPPMRRCAHAEPCTHASTVSTHAPAMHTRVMPHMACVRHIHAHIHLPHIHMCTPHLFVPCTHTHCAAYSTCMYHIQPE